MDNCTRCGDRATTTMNGARYCNPCSIEAAKGVPLAMFDRIIDKAELQRLCEAWPEWLAVGLRNADQLMARVISVTSGDPPHSDTNADAVTPVSAIGGVPTSAGIDDPTAPDATQ